MHKSSREHNSKQAVSNFARLADRSRMHSGSASMMRSYTAVISEEEFTVQTDSINCCEKVLGATTGRVLVPCRENEMGSYDEQQPLNAQSLS